MSGSRRSEPAKPVRGPRPLSSIGAIPAPGSRRTLTFPAEQTVVDERPERSARDEEKRSDEKRERTRAETIVPAAPDPHEKEEAPSQQPVLRWTTPNRRPLAPRAVERAARSSERLLRSSDTIDDAPSATGAVREERPSDRSTVPTALLDGAPLDASSASLASLASLSSAKQVSSAAKPSSAASVSSVAKPSSAASVSSVAKASSAAKPPSATSLLSAASPSSKSIVELSTSELESDHDVSPTHKTSSPPPLPKHPSYLAGLAAITRAARATVPAPPLAASAPLRPTLPSPPLPRVEEPASILPGLPGDAPNPPARPNDAVTPPLGVLAFPLRPPRPEPRTPSLGSLGGVLRPPRPEPRTPSLRSPSATLASKVDEPTVTAPLGAPPAAVDAGSVATEPLATEPLATEPLATEPLATEPLATIPPPSIGDGDDARASRPTEPLGVLLRPPPTEPPPPSVEPLVEPARLASSELPPRTEPPHVSTALSVTPATHVARDPAGDARAERRRRLRRVVVPLIASHAALAAVVVGLFVGVGRAPKAEAASREPRMVVDERSPLASVAVDPAPVPPLGGCLTGEPRTLARRAQLGPGLDVAVLETGFAVGLASGVTEALGVRVEGSGLRVAETIRVRTPLTVRRVTIDPGRDDDEALDLRLDAEDARTVFAGDNPAFRVVARGGGVMAIPDEKSGMRPRFLWPLPGVRRAAEKEKTPSRPQAQKASLHAKTAARTAQRARVTQPARPAPPPAPEIVRVAPRDEGGAIVAIRRPATLFVGLVDASLTPAGPLVTIFRKGATLGAPAVAQWHGGGVVAWAERPYGEREFDIVVASVTPDENGVPVLGPVRVIGKGMSPTIAAMPDGDLLLAYADGAAGAHRVVARRLTADLEPRGEPLVVSPESVNAGQPVVAVRADGRALVAFFAADRGPSGSVHVTPLACDPGL